MKAIIKDVKERNIQDGFDSWTIEGYTRLTTVSKTTGERVIYYATPHIMGSMWYDWSYVHFEDLTETKVIVQCTERPLLWSQVKYFLNKVVLGSDD